MAIVIPGASQLYRRLRFLPLVGSRAREEEQLMDATSTSPFAESFRLLALNINAVLADQPIKGVVVMSAYAEDGRSFIASNLSVALSERQPTILHDGHSRAREPVGALFKRNFLPPGDANGGQDSARLPSPLGEIARPAGGPQLWLTSARNTHPSETSHLGEIVRTASGAGITTVVDTPPASTSSEAFALAQEVGKVLYVVRRRPQDMEIHQRIRDQLQRLNATIIGLVTNEA
ncbi:MAG TPA: hypothetical protein VLS25_07575 [Dehalococcoidia bacterium]|nr:hypothetical protein [Dehalococcoidia bacterium]